MPLVTRPRRVEVAVKVGIPVSEIEPVDELVVGAPGVDVAVELDPVLGSEVGSEPVLETALVGVGETVGSVGTDPSPGKKLVVADGEVLEGSEAGTTPPPSVPSMQRPWHSVVLGLGVELPFWLGRPFSSGIVTSCPVPVVAVVVEVEVPVVAVVEVPVVVVPGVPCDPWSSGSPCVSEGSVPVEGFVPVAPAPAFAVAPVGVVASSLVDVGGGVAGCGVVSVWVVVGAGVVLVWVVAVVLVWVVAV
ncbi:MAG: hypothetical protein JO130_03000, partial [Solirubrobacterales bacterium]|nr:hypothetical protein [Solirubrobacterales bacterium]